MAGRGQATRERLSMDLLETVGGSMAFTHVIDRIMHPFHSIPSVGVWVWVWVWVDETDNLCVQSTGIQINYLQYLYTIFEFRIVAFNHTPYTLPNRALCSSALLIIASPFRLLSASRQFSHCASFAASLATRGRLQTPQVRGTKRYLIISNISDFFLFNLFI